MFEKGQIVIMRDGANVAQVVELLPNQYGRNRVTVEYIVDGKFSMTTVNNYNLKTLDDFQVEFNTVRDHK